MKTFLIILLVMLCTGACTYLSIAWGFKSVTGYPLSEIFELKSKCGDYCSMIFYVYRNSEINIPRDPVEFPDTTAI